MINVNGEKFLTIGEVGVFIGRSQHTINYWYLWKKEHPEHELAQLLPEYEQRGAKGTRYWRQSDIWKLLEFRARIPQGRNGIMKDSIEHYFKGGRDENRVGDADSAVCAQQE